MKTENTERVGELADRIQNLLGSIMIPVEDSMHVSMMKQILPEVFQELKEIYIDETNENPWE